MHGRGKFIFHFLEVLRRTNRIQAYACTGFVEYVDCLIGQESVADIAFGERHRGTNRFGRVMHLVVLLVLRTESFQNLDRIFRIRRIHDNRLEAAFKRGILLDVLAVFIDRRGTDALEFATSERRLKDVAGIKATFGAARAHNRMEFVDKENHRIIDALEFHNQALHAFFELAAVLGARHHGSHVERHHALVHQEFRNLLLDNLLCKAFDNRRLAHARFTDKRRVVLFAAAKNLDQAFNFATTPDNRVELALLGKRRQVATEVIENRSLGAALATHLLARVTTATLPHKAVIAIHALALFARRLAVHGLTLDLLQSTFKIFVSHAEG